MKELSRETWVFPTTLIDINLSQLGAAGWHLSSHSWHESPPLCILQQPWESGRQHWPAIDAEASPHIWKYSGVVWGENFAEKEPCPQGVTKFIDGKQSRNIWATVEGISYVKSKGWWRHTKAAFLGQLGLWASGTQKSWVSSASVYLFRAFVVFRDLLEISTDHCNSRHN